jgi:hypothetical protein
LLLYEAGARRRTARSNSSTTCCAARFAGRPDINARVASMLAERALGDVQLIPADIEGQREQYFVLVATRLIRCIDEKASEVRFWTPEQRTGATGTRFEEV